MPSSRLGTVCYVFFGTVGLTAVLIALNALIVGMAIMTGVSP